jgi:hypothetical protein
MTVQRGEWFTSSYSPDKDDCVEVRLGEVADVRDSKAPEDGFFTLSASAWGAFLRSVDPG